MMEMATISGNKIVLIHITVYIAFDFDHTVVDYFYYICAQMLSEVHK